jgi:hypothetical protein
MTYDPERLANLAEMMARAHIGEEVGDHAEADRPRRLWLHGGQPMRVGELTFAEWLRKGRQR